MSELPGMWEEADFLHGATDMPGDVHYRAQAEGVNGWVDGGLFTSREQAEADAARLARQYGVPTRVVVETSEGGRR